MWRMLAFCLLVLVLGLNSCTAGSVEKQFFAGEVSTRTSRLEGYPIEQQWRIFLYGNQVMHPPTTGLALPIAKRGKSALDYIVEQLQQSRNDLDYRDSMVVFQTMQWGGYYDICGDVGALFTIEHNLIEIGDTDWRNVYGRMLHDLCRKPN